MRGGGAGGGTAWRGGCGGAAAAGRGEAERYSRLDAELHVAIARAGGNPLYLHMVQSIRTAMQEASLRGMQLRVGREEIAAVQQMHEAIVGRIAARDSDGAFREMKRHMQMATEAFRRG